MTLKEIREKTLPPAKRQTEKWDIWSYVNRPVSYVVTKWLLNTKVSPTQVTVWSVIACIPAFGFLAFGKTTELMLLGWFFYFVWVVLDCVDGGLARCREQSSKMGELWDAFGGYVCTIAVYFSAGIAAFYDVNRFEIGESYWQIIIGASTAIFAILPRLIMQKKKNLNIDSDSVTSLADKHNFGLAQLIAMNVISCGGMMQVFLLLSIVFHVINIFNIFYFVIMLMFMLKTLYALLKF